VKERWKSVGFRACSMFWGSSKMRMGQVAGCIEGQAAEQFRKLECVGILLKNSLIREFHKCGGLAAVD
jgi:hypothetical protein